MPKPLLDVRLSPQPNIPIRSLVALPDPGPGTRLEGYVLTNGGLFSFRSVNVHQWTSSRVDIPQHEWSELLVIDRRARLFYANGEVLSLPGRVRLVPAVEGAPMVDFARACGQTFALSGDGTLYRLRIGIDGYGEWSPQQANGLHAAIPDPPVAAIFSPRFYPRPNLINLFTAVGWGVQLTPSPCNPEP